MKPVKSIPIANRTFSALRSLGYNLNSSIADVIDNSIEAKAKLIKIQLDKVKGKFCLYILDDGKGMTGKQLEESMRIGSDRTYENGDLGKFGLGLKTASLSHCNVLTVISKARRSHYAGYQWNMGHIEGTNDWEVLKLNENEIKAILQNYSIELEKPGTLVLWNEMSDLDREYASSKSQKLADNFIFKIINELRLYLATVFHRFLDGSLGNKRKITIYVNRERLKPWDPYCRKEAKTQKIKLSKNIAEFEMEGFKEKIFINAYILPNQENFSSDNAWKEAKGILSWNDAQGYYIYRDGRLIRFGGWQGTKAKDEHDKLARVSINVSSEMDELFKINVNKSTVQFPNLLFHHLKNNVNPLVIKKAQTQYRTNTSSHKVNNKLRKQINKFESIRESFVKEQKIKTTYDKSNGNISVTNPTGSFYANKLNDFLKYGTGNSFEVISEKLDSEHIWKIVCNTNEKFIVIINSDHPFYQKIYQTNSNKNVTNIVDAFIISLSFAELYNKNMENAQLFEFFQNITSLLLKKIMEENII